MKQFETAQIDITKCKEELAELKELLDKFESGILKERRDVLPFFREHRNVAILIGYLYTDCQNIDRIAYEFDFFGDYAADLALGDSEKAEYCFVEFENAAPDSIFKKAGKKDSLEWATQFDHGYSQIIDWFWKLNDLARSDSLRARFNHANSIEYSGLLVIGRSKGLKELENQRLIWRRTKVVVDSRRIQCVTFDELHEDLVGKLKSYGLVAENEGLLPDRHRGRRLRRKPKKTEFLRALDEEDAATPRPDDSPY